MGAGRGKFGDVRQLEDGVLVTLAGQAFEVDAAGGFLIPLAFLGVERELRLGVG